MMTWFIDTAGSKFPVVSTTYTYSGGSRTNPPPTVIFGQPRRPFTDEELKSFPKSAVVAIKAPEYIQHFVLACPYYLLSEGAVKVLTAIQPDGWQLVPITIASHEFASAKSIAKGQYYLVNVLINRNIVDLGRSDMGSRISNAETKYATRVHILTEGHRTPAVKEALVGSTHLWSGADHVLDYVTFVSNDLKSAWCELGMNPDVFESCVAV